MGLLQTMNTKGPNEQRGAAVAADNDVVEVDSHLSFLFHRIPKYARVRWNSWALDHDWHGRPQGEKMRAMIECREIASAQDSVRPCTSWHLSELGRILPRRATVP